jgi:hypothetical protein
MNLYDLHSEPKSLDHYDAVHDKLPSVFWAKYKSNPAELKKREQYIAASVLYSYKYAGEVLKGAFKAGEAAIARDAPYSYMYAEYVLNGPFKIGEPAIAKSEFKDRYEKFVGYKL